MKTEKDAVIYRKYNDGEIIAVFPYIIHNGYFVTCFSANEGHSGCDYQHIIKTTKPCNENEYKYRDRLLRNFYGYNTHPIKKYSHKKYLEAYYKAKH